VDNEDSEDGGALLLLKSRKGSDLSVAFSWADSNLVACHI
jgi:hypothetical protein